MNCAIGTDKTMEEIVQVAKHAPPSWFDYITPQMGYAKPKHSLTTPPEIRPKIAGKP